MGFLASLLAGLLTGVGALPVLFGRARWQRLNDVLLSFAAGVMLAASFFSLIVPGLDAALPLYEGPIVAASIASGGVLLGAGFIALLNECIPHEHFFQGRQGPLPARLAGIWLFFALGPR
jgi:ZIP family zinc transporter